MEEDIMRTKTIWTVAAGTTAAVLAPGVAHALAVGEPATPAESSVAVQQDVGADASADSAEVVSAISADEPAAQDPGEAPAVESMASVGSAVSAMTPASPVSAQSAISAQSAQSAPSAQSAQS